MIYTLVLSCSVEDKAKTLLCGKGVPNVFSSYVRAETIRQKCVHVHPIFTCNPLTIPCNEGATIRLTVSASLLLLPALVLPGEVEGLEWCVRRRGEYRRF